ncbi:MAG: hypothetical protein DSY37_02775 [Hyperthermus sp.]|nr:MAG: hypothetical protein DSY37_02775 [Hyperthermus sp.]
MLKEKPRLDMLVSAIAEASIRKAAGLNYQLTRLTPTLQDTARKLVEEISSSLAINHDSIIRCKLCGRGPFTRKGYYLHAKRVHMDTIKLIVHQKLSRELWLRVEEERSRPQASEKAAGNNGEAAT